MKKLALVTCIAVLLLNTPAKATGDFFISTDVGSSAEMIGQANVEGFTDKANNVFDNPAGLYRINQFSTSLFTTTFMNEVNYKNISVAMRLPEGVIGLGYMSTDVSGLISTTANRDENQDITEITSDGHTFGYNNTMIKASYQWSQTEHLHWGTSAAYYTTSIGDVTGQGINLDAGVILDYYPLILSISAKNVLGGKVKYSNGGEENLPLQTTYGAQYNFNEFQIAGQFKSKGSNHNMLKSASIAYHPSALPFLELSGGYKEYSVLDAVKSNLTFGLGLNLSTISFNYAYESSENIQFNHKHYFSVGLSF